MESSDQASGGGWREEQAGQLDLQELWDELELDGFTNRKGFAVTK